MKQSAYREHDYAFGQLILTLRAAVGLTQAGLAEVLGISRRSVADWEAGSKYPKAEHLKQFIALAIKHQAFQAGREEEEIRALWKAAHQKVLLDDVWLATALLPLSGQKTGANESIQRIPTDDFHNKSVKRNVAVNLPFQATPFIGRGTEITETIRIFRYTACRLLTLLGPGGVGKTRLAIEIAARQAEAFTDGAIFVPLASVSTHNQIVSAIGDALSLSFSEHADSTAVLLNYLRGKEMLLVLDNFEHLLDGAEVVHDILRHTPQITVLVTSRARLDLQAEWLFDVEGLSYPTGNSSKYQGEMVEYSAVQLFVQRATQIQPGFTLSSATNSAIVRICQHVAGMPLAIELAAAGTRMHAIEEIEQQINVNLDVLSTTLRDVPPRHRSLRAVFDHSWNLLSEQEHNLLSRLAIFRGGCTVEAAEQVAGATLSSLLKLVDKSLVQQINDQRKSNATAESRFLLLEPIREYALEKLSVGGKVEELQYAHATYYLALAEAAAAQWDTPMADAALEQIDREHDNIYAALQWSRDGGDHIVGLKLASSLRRFWRMHGYISEGRVWLDELLAHEESNPIDMAVRMRALHVAAWLATDQHDFAQAALLFEQSAALGRLLGETEGDANLLINAGLQARAVGQYQQATMLLQDALSQLRAMGDRGSLSSGGMGFSLYALALVYREQGNFEQATALFEECKAFHQEIGENEGAAQAQLGIADVARDLGNIVQTQKYSQECLRIFQEFGTQWAIGFVLNNLAQAAYLEVDLDHALTFATESVSLFRNIKNDGSLAEVLITLGAILLAGGDLTAANEALKESLQLARGVGPRLLVAAALEGLSAVMIAQLQTKLAVQLLAAASGLRTEMGTPLRPVDQPAFEQIMVNAQLKLGTDIFSAVWSAAEKLPLEQIFRDSSDVLKLPSLATTPTTQSDERASVHRSEMAAAALHVDWNDAPSVLTFYGREWELNLLREWVVEERCRVISILGLGGIGKSTLAVTLMHQLVEHFEVVIWRSLRDVPNCDVLLDELLEVVAPQVLGGISLSLERRQSVLLEYMRTTRVLLVLDNLESVLEEGEDAGRMCPGYEGFGRFLRLSAETEHQSCVVLTSREKPKDLVPLEGSRAPVRALRLARLDAESCEQLLAEIGIISNAADRAHLIEAYAGNPMALKIVARTIVDLFDGEAAPFLAQGEVIFGGIRELLNQQFVRLSALEQGVLLWLAIMREPTSLDELLKVLVTPVPRAQLLEVIETLHRNSLIERGHKRGTFTLQSIVLEYVTAQLIAETTAEIEQGQLTRLIEHRLQLVQSYEYVRQNQERLILAPILANLQSAYTLPAIVEDRLLTLLDQLRTKPQSLQGYAPANLVSILWLLRGDLRNLDLSRLMLRGVNLQGVEMQDTTLAEALIQDTIFTAPFDAVTAVAISSAGTYWAAATRGGEVRIWDADGLTVRRAWQAHSDMIWALAFSPDGRLLASGSWDGALKLWDMSSGELRWSGRHTSHVNTVVFAPDGSMLASCGNDATVRLWDVQSGTPLHLIPHSLPVPVVAWSPDGCLIATGDLEGSIRLWNLQEDGTPSNIQTLVGHTAAVDGLAFTSDARTLASASWDGTVKLWNVFSGHLKQTLEGHTDRVIRVAWSPDGHVLATGSRDHMIWLWAVEQDNYQAALRGHSAGVNGIAFTLDNRRLLSGGEDGTLRVWDVTSGRCTHVLQGYASALYDIDWSPDSTQLASGGTDYLVTTYDTTSSTPPTVLSGHGGVVLGVSWSSDGRLVSSEWDNIVRLWDVTSRDTIQILQHPDDPGNFFYGLAWSPDGQRLACATYRRGVHVFEMNASKQGWVARPFPTWIRHVTWSPDGTQLAGGGDDGTVYIWDATDGMLLYRLAGHYGMITRVAWSPDGTLLASSGGGIEGGELFVWDPQHGKLVHTVGGHPGIVYAMVWGVTKQFLISGGADGKLRWWNIQDGTCIRECEAHQGTIQSLRRSPDLSKLASCGNDGAIMLWDLDSGEYLKTLRRDRPYERLNITKIKGLTEPQKSTLRVLGAIEDHSSHFL